MTRDEKMILKAIKNAFDAFTTNRSVKEFAAALANIADAAKSRNSALLETTIATTLQELSDHAETSGMRYTIGLIAYLDAIKLNHRDAYLNAVQTVNTDNPLMPMGRSKKDALEPAEFKTQELTGIPQQLLDYEYARDKKAIKVEFDRLDNGYTNPIELVSFLREKCIAAENTNSHEKLIALTLVGFLRHPDITYAEPGITFAKENKSERAFAMFIEMVKEDFGQTALKNAIIKLRPETQINVTDMIEDLIKAQARAELAHAQKQAAVKAEAPAPTQKQSSTSSTALLQSGMFATLTPHDILSKFAVADKTTGLAAAVKTPVTTQGLANPSPKIDNTPAPPSAAEENAVHHVKKIGVK